MKTGENRLSGSVLVLGLDFMKLHIDSKHSCGTWMVTRSGRNVRRGDPRVRIRFIQANANANANVRKEPAGLQRYRRRKSRTHSDLSQR